MTSFVPSQVPGKLGASASSVRSTPVTRLDGSARLLVFDLDGTLIDSSADLCCSVNAALSHVGRPTLDPRQITSFIGDGAPMLVRRALANSHTPWVAEDDREFRAALSFFLDYYREHKLDQTRPYPAVLPALQSIRELRPQTAMAVLTNKPVRPSREICAALGLSPFFFAIYGGDSFAKKPNPEGLRSLIDEARRSPKLDASTLALAEVVMIGDSHVDVQTARGCSVRCLYGLSPGTLAEARPDVLVDSPADWVGALGFKP